MMDAFIVGAVAASAALIAPFGSAVWQRFRTAGPVRRLGGRGQAFVQLAGILLPAAARQRYVEEWRAELAELDGWGRLRHALDLLRAASCLAWQLRFQRARPRRGPHQHVIPLGDEAPARGWLSAAFLVESNDRGARYRLMVAVRHDDDVRMVRLSRYSRVDSGAELVTLLQMATTLGPVSKRAYRKSRRSKQVTW